jgi:DMSO/TMAO reductase YedYZ molybdopterin-dependent catalytic subunit
MVLRSLDPLNCETPISALVGGTVTPIEHFYVRNHFDAPPVDGARWRLEVDGLVRRPLSLGLRDLMNMPAVVVTATLECAGNGRAFLTPPVGGEQWELGAVSTAEWTGVRLSDVLDLAGIKPGAQGVVFKAADRGAANHSGGASRFERSLTLDEVAESEALLAYGMNGAPLPVQHGYPLRVIVPGWYGVAAVKWLTEIEVVGHSFTGYFQTEKYVFEWKRSGSLEREPVRQMRVRSLITEPASGADVDVGTVAVRGLAWSGVAPIDRVDVSVNGEPWQHAKVLGQPSMGCWQRWELITQIGRPGPVTLRSRATDQTMRTQPDHPEWNRLGYGNNAIQEVRVNVRPAASTRSAG